MNSEIPKFPLNFNFDSISSTMLKNYQEPCNIYRQGIISDGFDNILAPSDNPTLFDIIDLYHSIFIPITRITSDPNITHDQIRNCYQNSIVFTITIFHKYNPKLLHAFFSLLSDPSLIANYKVNITHILAIHQSMQVLPPKYSILISWLCGQHPAFLDFPQPEFSAAKRILKWRELFYTIATSTIEK